MNWIWLLNTGNYPEANYVNHATILAVLAIVLIGIARIIRGKEAKI